MNEGVYLTLNDLQYNKTSASFVWFQVKFIIISFQISIINLNALELNNKG